MNNVTEIKKDNKVDKGKEIKTINIKFTSQEKEYYKMIADYNNVTLTEVIKSALRNTYPDLSSMKINKVGNLKDLGIQ